MKKNFFQVDGTNNFSAKNEICKTLGKSEDCGKLESLDLSNDRGSVVDNNKLEGDKEIPNKHILRVGEEIVSGVHDALNRAKINR